MTKIHLPFNVDQTVEAKSFEEGFRGAWFRCKIRDINRRKDGLFYKLEYLDFPDEKLHLTKIYQKLKLGNKNSSEQEHLMIRPTFPTVYRENEVADINNILEAVVVVNDAWNVGDLVDWFSDDCYWSGTIIEVLGNEKFRIELFPEPIGEGKCYEALRNDLRPSLEWSPDNGWTVSFSKNREKRRCCARLMKPANKGNFASLTTKTPRVGELKILPKAPASVNQMASPSPQKSPPRTAASKRRCGAESTNASDCVMVESCRTDSVSGSRVASGEVSGATCGTEEEEDTGGASKKLKTEGSILLNTMVSDTIEAAVLDLEELVSRIKWLKFMLTSNSVNFFPDTAKSSWVFAEYRPSSTPR